MQAHHDLDRLARQVRTRSGRRSSLLLLAILGFILLAGIWAAFTEIDDVTRGDGRIVPSQTIQIVQAAEAGVLKALYVAEGDIVEAGERLLDLDPTVMVSQRDQERQREIGLMARLARLEAELADAHSLILSEDLLHASPAIAASEIALFTARQEALIAEKSMLERQQVQRRQEHEEALVDRSIATQTLALVNQEVDMLAPLVARQLEPATTLLTLRRSQAEWQGRAVRSEATLVRLNAALDEIDDRRAVLRASTRAEARRELALATAELAELRAHLPALEQRVSRAEVRAPVRGVINRIMPTTLGGVVQAGDTLVELVPVEGILLVEAYLKPSDIAFIYPGQPVKVRLTAYDATRYGSLNGAIQRLGANTVERPDRNEQAYVVHIRTESNILDADGAAVEIVPGMVAEVDILAGRKTILDYILKPVIRIRDSAFKD